MATAEPSRQITSPAMETGRDRYAARVYSRTRMATSALVGWRAKTGAEPPVCTPKAICAAPITAATANAATG